MRTHCEYRHSPHLVLMAAQKFTKLIIQLPFYYLKSYESWKPLVVVCVGIIPLYSRELNLVHVFASGSDMCHLFQMSASGSMNVDAQAWTHLNCLEEGGFPALLCDTLKDFGYTAYPEYSARELMTTCQLLRWEVNVKIPVCPTHPT
jgi:hypothetical protein